MQPALRPTTTGERPADSWGQVVVISAAMLALVAPAAVALRLLTAAPVLQLAVPELGVINLPQASGGFYSEHLAQALAAAGAKVVTNRQITAVLGIERQRQVLGCAGDGSNCIAELTNALGVDAVVLGDVAKLERSYQLNVRVISAKSAQALASHSARLSSEEAVLDDLSATAAQLAAEVGRKLGRGLTPAGEAPVAVRQAGPLAGARRWSWVPAAVGLVAAGGGAFAGLQANSRYQELTTTQNLDAGRAGVLHDDGNTWKLATQVGIGVGVAGLVTGAALWLLGDDGRPVPSAALGPSGVSIGLAWRLP